MRTTDLDVRLHVGLIKNGKTEDHLLYHRVSKAVAGMSAAQISSFLDNELRHVSLEQSFQIYNAIVKYSYEDATALERFVYGDTFIQTTLPYCLHLRHGTELEVRVPQRGYSALVTLQKIWTKK